MGRNVGNVDGTVSFAPNQSPKTILALVQGNEAAYAKQAFRLAAQAALPTGDEGTATMLRTGRVPKPNAKDVIARFDSVTEFVQACEASPVFTAEGQYGSSYGPTYAPNPVRLKNYMAKGHELGPVWEGLSAEPLKRNEYGNCEPYEGPRPSWDEVKGLWFGGWPEGIARMRESMGRLEVPETRDIRRKGAWGADGGELSTDRLYAGAWDNAWRTTRRRAVIAPTRVRIVVDMGSSCGMCNNLAHDAEIVEASTLFWRGAAACALTETLEAAGFSVEVVCAAVAQEWEYNGRDYTECIHAASVTVKGFSDQADLALLAGTTANASFFRRGFICWQLAHAKTHVSDCHGQLVRVDRSEWVGEELGLYEEGVATLIVPDWVLSAPLANAWAKAAHAGLESVNDPEAAEEELTHALEMGGGV